MLLGIEPPDKFPLVFYRDNASDTQLTIDDVKSSLIELEPATRSLAAPYAIQTILDEISMPAMVFRDGEFIERPALGEEKHYLFPEGISSRVQGGCN